MLPASVLIKDQKLIATKVWVENDERWELNVTIRYDDQCGNGHNTFAITGETRVNGKWDSCGCLHELIEKKFPHYRHLIKWHLVSSDGPMHYIANTTYQTSSRDHWGLLKGERRQLTDRKTGKLSWELKMLDKQGNIVSFEENHNAKYIDSDEKPECPFTLAYVPWEIVGEGKEQNFKAARSCAVWPEATDEELSAPDLETKLKARLPDLMEKFKRDIEALGFTY